MGDGSAMVAGQMGQLLPLDEETIPQFQPLTNKMMEHAEESNHDEKVFIAVDHVARF